MSYKMPEVSGPKYGCFAKVPSYPPDNSKINFRSIYQDSYLTRFQHSKFKSITGEILTNKGIYSGMKSDFVPFNKKHISSKLINERYNNGNESKSNTEIQRSWTYHSDPAIEAIEKLKIDNASRVPIEKEIKEKKVENKKLTPEEERMRKIKESLEKYKIRDESSNKKYRLKNMKEYREMISIYYQPINGKETTKKDIEIIGKYLSQMAKDKELSDGMFGFHITK